MNNGFYDMIFKRKSFHLFKGVGKDMVAQTELEEIKTAFDSFESLCPDIKTAIRIVPSDKISFRKDAEYCILLYSEKKDNYLVNAGYLGEQLDLYLVSHNIGSLWFGIGRPDEQTYNGLDFVIMLAIHKVNDDEKYRRDMFSAKRKPLEDIWQGDDLGVANIARFAPSACNSQPWFVKNQNGVLSVSRYRKSGRIGLLTPTSALYFNRIDIGIYLCILEICLNHEKIDFKREIFVDKGTDAQYTEVAKYYL